MSVWTREAPSSWPRWWRLRTRCQSRFLTPAPRWSRAPILNSPWPLTSATPQDQPGSLRALKHYVCAAGEWKEWTGSVIQEFLYIYLYIYFWPLTLKDDLDLSPLKMCSSMRYTCMPNMKLLQYCKSYDKTLRFLKVLERQTDRMTDRQTGQNQYTPFFLKRGHKNNN